jgi:hypothetical protein
MQLEINYEPEDEEVTIIVDNADVLKATLGEKNLLVLNKKFKDIKDDNEKLYTALRSITLSLMELTEV